MDELDIKLQRMRSIIRADSKNPLIRNYARMITKGETTDLGKVRALYNWVRNNIRYQREPRKLDIFIRPVMVMLNKDRTGFDCEDQAGLISSMALSLGLPVKHKVISCNGRWSHIYPIIGYMPADTAAPVAFGREVSYRKARVYKL